MDSKEILILIWNEEINDILKIFKPFEKPGLLVKAFSETMENEAKKKKKKKIYQHVITYNRG